MKKIIVDKTILLFLGINDFNKYTKNDLINKKNELLTEYDNCLIYNYYDLRDKKQMIIDKINKRLNKQFKIARKNHLLNLLA